MVATLPFYKKVAMKEVFINIALELHLQAEEQLSSSSLPLIGSGTSDSGPDTSQTCMI